MASAYSHVLSAFLFQTAANGTNLELQPTLDVLLQRLGDGLVEVAENLHGELGVYALFADQVVEGVCQSEPDAVNFVFSWLLVFFLVVQFHSIQLLGLGMHSGAGKRLPASTVELVERLCSGSHGLLSRGYTLCSAEGFRVYRGLMCSGATCFARLMLDERGGGGQA